MRVLVLCSGTGSIDRAIERRGWEVTSVDWLAKFGPTLCMDITEWDYRAAFPKDHFQFVWASPACTHFSLARTTGGPRDLEGATALLARCLGIADYFGCEWCLENPATGLLRRQPLMQGLAWRDTCYCKYSFEYRNTRGCGTRAPSGNRSGLSPSVGVSGSKGNHRQTKGTMGTIGTRSILHLFLGFLQQPHFSIFDDNF